MSAADNTSYGAMLRELWPQDDIIDETYDVNRSGYGLMEKDTSFEEAIRHIAVGIGDTGGASAKFSSAKAGKQPTQELKFDITPVTYYSFFSITRQLIRRTKSKKAAIKAALERQAKGAIHMWKRRQGIYMFNTAVGGVGQVLTAPLGTATKADLTTVVLTSSQIQLTQAVDMRHFTKGVNVEFSVDNTGSAGVRTMIAPLVVSSLNRDDGIITFAQPVLTLCPTFGGANDYIYFAGDYNSVFSGMGQWCPISAPSSTSFFGRDRTVDAQLLGGWRVNCKNKSMRAAAMTTAKVLHEIGAQPTHCFYSPNDFLNLQIELESAGALKTIKEPAAAINGRVFGEPYEGISLMGPGGLIKCFFDINVPDNYAWMSQFDTWKFASMGDVPYFSNEDGNELRKEQDADAFEEQFVGDFQAYNAEAPAYTAVQLLNGS
jgi:hypothetical protein